MRYGGLLFTGHKDSLLPVINMKHLKHLPYDTYRISHCNDRLFFADIRNARRKTIDLIFIETGSKKTLSSRPLSDREFPLYILNFTKKETPFDASIHPRLTFQIDLVKTATGTFAELR